MCCVRGRVCGREEGGPVRSGGLGVGGQFFDVAVLLVEVAADADDGMTLDPLTHELDRVVDSAVIYHEPLDWNEEESGSPQGVIHRVFGRVLVGGVTAVIERNEYIRPVAVCPEHEISAGGYVLARVVTKRNCEPSAAGDGEAEADHDQQKKNDSDLTCLRSASDLQNREEALSGDDERAKDTSQIA